MVPPSSALYWGVAVNIILKAHQKSGKLTFGHIQDVLTRGDHPRGVKVRLQDGQIGRVQSLARSDPQPAALSFCANTSVNSINERTSADDVPQPAFSLDPGKSPEAISRASHGRQRPRFAASDVRGEEESLPAETRSLEDYVTVKNPRQRRGQGGKAKIKDSDTGVLDDLSLIDSRDELGDPHTVLQEEFPGIDSALIAAILSDGLGIEEAKKVLSGLVE